MEQAQRERERLGHLSTATRACEEPDQELEHLAGTLASEIQRQDERFETRSPELRRSACAEGVGSVCPGDSASNIIDRGIATLSLVGLCTKLDGLGYSPAQVIDLLKAFNGDSTVPVSADSVTSTALTRSSVRKLEYNDEARLLAEREGFCYLRLIRNSRRADVARVLGSTPTLKALYSLPVDDLAVGAWNNLWVTRSGLAYHVAGEGDTPLLELLSAATDAYGSMVPSGWRVHREFACDAPPIVATFGGLKLKSAEPSDEYVMMLKARVKPVETPVVEHQTIRFEGSFSPPVVDGSVDPDQEFVEIVHTLDEAYGFFDLRARASGEEVGWERSSLLSSYDFSSFARSGCVCGRRAPHARPMGCRASRAEQAEAVERTDVQPVGRNVLPDRNVSLARYLVGALPDTGVPVARYFERFSDYKPVGSLVVIVLGSPGTIREQFEAQYPDCYVSVVSIHAMRDQDADSFCFYRPPETQSELYSSLPIVNEIVALGGKGLVYLNRSGQGDLLVNCFRRIGGEQVGLLEGVTLGPNAVEQGAASLDVFDRTGETNDGYVRRFHCRLMDWIRAETVCSVDLG